MGATFSHRSRGSWGVSPISSSRQRSAPSPPTAVMTAVLAQRQACPMSSEVPPSKVSICLTIRSLSSSHARSQIENKPKKPTEFFSRNCVTSDKRRGDAGRVSKAPCPGGGRNAIREPKPSRGSAGDQEELMLTFNHFNFNVADLDKSLAILQGGPGPGAGGGSGRRRPTAASSSSTWGTERRTSAWS